MEGWEFLDRMARREHVELDTRLLRSDTEPFWLRLRACLREKGTEPNTAVLATCFPDDSSFEFGIIVTPDGEVYEFGFDWFHKPVDEGTLTEWTRTTDHWRDQAFYEHVEAALELIERERE
jgi:hypothetical protein